MGSDPLGAPIYLLGKELITHYQSSFVALYRILHKLLQGWCTPVLRCIIFLVANHRTTSTTLSRIWCVGWTLCESQAVPALLLHPKRELPQQNVPCLLRWYARHPISWWRPFPERGRIPMAYCLPLVTFVFKGFLLVTVKVMLPTPWLRRHFLPVVRIAVLFPTLGRHNIPLTTDEEESESTNAIRSIPLIFTFITGSTSSLCGERVVLASCPLPHFPDTSMWQVLVAGTDNSVSLGALFVICPPGYRLSLAKWLGPSHL